MNKSVRTRVKTMTSSDLCASLPCCFQYPFSLLPFLLSTPSTFDPFQNRRQQLIEMAERTTTTTSSKAPSAKLPKELREVIIGLTLDLLANEVKNQPMENEVIICMTGSEAFSRLTAIKDKEADHMSHFKAGAMNLINTFGKDECERTFKNVSSQVLFELIFTKKPKKPDNADRYFRSRTEHLSFILSKLMRKVGLNEKTAAAHRGGTVTHASCQPIGHRG